MHKVHGHTDRDPRSPLLGLLSEPKMSIFSREDAALQVLMSVCLSVCVCVCVCGQPEKLPFYILLQHPECSRMFQNACRMFLNACRIFQNACRMFQNACRMFQNACKIFQNVQEYSRMHAECVQNVPKFMQNVYRIFQNVPTCMQIYELACRSMCLHAVT